MSDLVFDTSSVITLSMNNLLGKVRQLKGLCKGKFLITEEVKKELIDRPLQGKKYKLGALQIGRLIKSGVLEIVNKGVDVSCVLDIVNNIYFGNKKPIIILSKGEIESLMLAIKVGGVYVVDERTMRMVIEDAEGLRVLLEKKLHSRIIVNKNNLNKFRNLIKKVDIIRSCELIMVAFEKGFFKELGDKKDVLDALLWGLKLRGCAISVKEIYDIEKMY